MAKQFTFGKQERIKSRKQAEQLFSKGKKFFQDSLRIHYLTVNGNGEVKIGVAVSTRNFKKAVDRNRIKRLLRESIRIQKTNLIKTVPADKYLSVFFIYSGKELPDYREIFDQVGKAIQKLEKISKNH